jgi:type I restriction-modification system DNA methylase subunit
VMKKVLRGQNKILFIDACESSGLEKGKQNFVLEHHRRKILDAYFAFKDIRGIFFSCST